MVYPALVSFARVLSGRLVAVVPILLLVSPAAASHTPTPTSVTIVGSFQSELGCAGDWLPDCAATQLVFDAVDQVWQGVFNIPAGNWEYKVAIDGSWDENYGADATQNGANIALSLSEAAPVKFYYSHTTHWVADNHTKTIATAVGSFQSELGCSGDWQPDCLRSWLQDPDGDGIYSFFATLPAGSYEAKVAINESFSENYGADGVPNGANIAFDVPSSCTNMAFRYDASTHVVTISHDCTDDAIAALEALVDVVSGYPSKPLTAMLRDALALLNEGDVAGAMDKLGDALRFTNAQSGRRLTTAQAEYVSGAIEAILELLQ